MLKQVSTKELTNELINRLGVQAITLEPYQEAKITTETSEQIFQGPAVILINQD
ncbi:MAG: BC1881 family protein [Firmicutes bacterium]|nr:BC1881 family protein [Bacillota bacterium]